MTKYFEVVTPRATLSSLSSASIKHSTPTYPAAVPRWVSKLDETAGSVENLRDATAASRDMRDLSLDTLMAARNESCQRDFTKFHIHSSQRRCLLGPSPC